MLKRVWFLPLLLLGACAPAASGPVGENIPRESGRLPYVMVPADQERTFLVPLEGQSAVVIGREISLDGQKLQSHLLLLNKNGRYTVTVKEGGVVYVPREKLAPLKEAYPQVGDFATEQFYKFCYLPERGDQCVVNVLSGGIALYFNPLEETPIVQVYGDPGVRNFTEFQGRGFLFTTSISDFKTFLGQLQ